jgi:hypothetical protein
MSTVRRLALLVSVSFLVGTTARAAEPSFPSIVGTWIVKGDGAIMAAGTDVGAVTHWRPGQSSVNGELVITEQRGRVVKGTFRTAKANEPFVGAFGHDGKVIYFVDTDGYFDGRIVDGDTIEYVYRHSTPKNSVVAVGVFSRKK